MRQNVDNALDNFFGTKMKMISQEAKNSCAATLLTGGPTVHSIFRFGINIEQDYTPSVSMQSFHGKRISESQVIIVEVSMLPKHMLEAIEVIEVIEGYIFFTYSTIAR